ncbi:SET domain-containing protein [Caenorhabditis elegans]|uniref:SET domain-containing protein n=1 Tax=Caenorhabditis elegans TaxID=6239 RepID=O45995_CAEEL|nr:SET domain-containing protein [Caenorhabditis elegans]CAB04980.2 SET domain-containing protein [Caenorhabditis elegans]|eukprot:NP_493323.2 Uncharacterized protein CELE_ZK1053.4 [Caenorhabditis elegans]
MQPSTVPTETLQSRMSGFNERLKKATNVTEQVAVMEDMKKDSEVYDSWSKHRQAQLKYAYTSFPTKFREMMGGSSIREEETEEIDTQNSSETEEPSIADAIASRQEFLNKLVETTDQLIDITVDKFISQLKNCHIRKPETPSEPSREASPAPRLSSPFERIIDETTELLAKCASSGPPDHSLRSSILETLFSEIKGKSSDVSLVTISEESEKSEESEESKEDKGSQSLNTSSISTEPSPVQTSILKPPPMYPETASFPHRKIRSGAYSLYPPPQPSQQFVHSHNFHQPKFDASSMLSTGYCPSRNVATFKVDKPYGTVFTYDHQNRKFQEHCCVECREQIEENDLYPLYAVWCEKISNHVIFMEIGFTEEIGQFVFSFKTGGFEQVDFPELVFSEHVEYNGSFVAMIAGEGEDKVIIERDESGEKVRKLLHKFGHSVQIPYAPVRPLWMQKAEEPVEEDVEPESDAEPEETLDAEHVSYITSLPTYKKEYCQTYEMDVLYMLQPNGQYLKYSLNDDENELNLHVCDCCKTGTTENDLIPKYSEYCAKTCKYIIHVQNQFTEKMETYAYDCEKKRFHQVTCPGLVYDSEKVQEGNIFFILEQNSMQGVEVIMRDDDGQLRKEQFCMVKKQFVKLPKTTVATFAVQIAEKKMKNLLPNVEIFLPWPQRFTPSLSQCSSVQAMVIPETNHQLISSPQPTPSEID